MTCAEFQKVLPYIIESGGNAEQEAHLKECHVCADLVHDLRYIADQAKLLVPMEEPSPQVWDGIRDGLEREGLVKKPARARGRLLGNQANIPWTALGIVIVLLLAAVAVFHHPRPSAVPATQAAAAPEDDAQDEPVLAQLAQSRPEVKAAYETNFKQVNQSIKETTQALQRDPDDEDARNDLQHAYEQKAMLYNMAARSLP